jgi:hypothetical protein
MQSGVLAGDAKAALAEEGQGATNSVREFTESNLQFNRSP